MPSINLTFHLSAHFEGNNSLTWENASKLWLNVQRKKHRENNVRNLRKRFLVIGVDFFLINCAFTKRTKNVSFRKRNKSMTFVVDKKILNKTHVHRS